MNATTRLSQADTGQIKRTVNILRAQGITSRSEFGRRYDKDADLEAIKGVGPVRADLLKWLLSLEPVAWTALTGLEA